jgi:hypothetical protein
MGKRAIIQSVQWVMVDRDTRERTILSDTPPYTDVLFNGVAIPFVTGAQEGDGDGFVRCDVPVVPDGVPYVEVTGQDMTQFAPVGAMITYRVAVSEAWNRCGVMTRRVFDTEHTVTVEALLRGRVEFRLREPTP